MSATLSRRRLVDATYVTARPSIAFPFPHEVDLAPQLLLITLAQAALAATHRALDSAHPILTFAKVPGERSQLTDSEHLAMLLLEAGNRLSTLLADYAAAVVHDSYTPDDDPPF
jgi:hypothetical protein